MECVKLSVLLIQNCPDVLEFSKNNELKETFNFKKKNFFVFIITQKLI